MSDVRRGMMRLAESLCLEADRFRIEAPELSQQLWDQARGILVAHTELRFSENLPRSRALVPLSPPTPKSRPRVRDDPEFGQVLLGMSRRIEEIKKERADAVVGSKDRKGPYSHAVRFFSAFTQWLAFR